MINSSNITEYIQFLYLQKYKTEAALEVLNSWKNIPDENINGYLQELYQHWGLSNLEAQTYERKFLNPQTNKTVNDIAYMQPITAAPRPQYEYQQAPVKSKSPWKAIIIILVFALMAIIAYLAYNLMYKPQNEEIQPVDTSATTVVPIQHSAPVPSEPEPEPVSQVNQADYEKTMTIKQLFTAEENRDLSGILSTFSPYMERYWDINYPTQEELSNAYQKTWDNTKDNKNTNIQIKKVNDSTFNASTTYTYYSLKDQKSKSVNSTVQYIFDNQNKIVKAYGL